MVDYSNKWEEHGKKRARLEFMSSINKIEFTLKVLSHGPNFESLREKLVSENNVYNLNVQFYKREFEYEDSEFQKQYEKMLPEINKYIGENKK